MYDELIKRLRTDALLVVTPLCDDLIDAADAIEKLSKRVPVPPHGRLIDADALMEILSKVIDINASIEQRNEATDQERRCLWWFEQQIRIAPTIIPAEGG